MFGFSKQEKLKKLMLKNYRLSESILLEQKNLDRSSDLFNLQYNDLELHLKEIGLIYEQLRKEYKDFNIIDKEENWKLLKPKYSQGEYFVITNRFNKDFFSYYSKYHGSSTPYISISIEPIFHKYTVIPYNKVEKLGGTDLLLKAIKKKAQNEAERESQRILGKIDLDLLDIYLQIKKANTTYVITNYKKTSDLSKLAKLTNTNIVVK